MYTPSFSSSALYKFWRFVRTIKNVHYFYKEHSYSIEILHQSAKNQKRLYKIQFCFILHFIGIGIHCAYLSSWQHEGLISLVAAFQENQFRDTWKEWRLLFKSGLTQSVHKFVDWILFRNSHIQNSCHMHVTGKSNVRKYHPTDRPLETWERDMLS